MGTGFVKKYHTNSQTIGESCLIHTKSTFNIFYYSKLEGQFVILLRMLFMGYPLSYTKIIIIPGKTFNIN